LLHKGRYDTCLCMLTNQVYTLEKVLKIKKDPVTQTEFLDDVMKVSRCDGSEESHQLTCSGWMRSQASHSGRPWRMRSKRRRGRLRAVSHYPLMLAILLADCQHQIGFSKHSVLATLVYSGCSTTSSAALRCIQIQSTLEIVKGRSL